MKVFRKDVRAGDWADHKSRSLDPRRVTRINSRSVYLDIGGKEIGPCPASNYTYTRDAESTDSEGER